MTIIEKTFKYSARTLLVVNLFGESILMIGSALLTEGSSNSLALGLAITGVSGTQLNSAVQYLVLTRENDFAEKLGKVLDECFRQRPKEIKGPETNKLTNKQKIKLHLTKIGFVVLSVGDTLITSYSSFRIQQLLLNKLMPVMNFLNSENIFMLAASSAGITGLVNLLQNLSRATTLSYRIENSMRNKEIISNSVSEETRCSTVKKGLMRTLLSLSISGILLQTASEGVLITLAIGGESLGVVAAITLGICSGAVSMAELFAVTEKGNTLKQLSRFSRREKAILIVTATTLTLLAIADVIITYSNEKQETLVLADQLHLNNVLPNIATALGVLLETVQCCFGFHKLLTYFWPSPPDTQRIEGERTPLSDIEAPKPSGLAKAVSFFWSKKQKKEIPSNETTHLINNSEERSPKRERNCCVIL